MIKIVGMTNEHIKDLAELEKECFHTPWTEKQLEEELKRSMDGITELNMDFEKLEYLSSAGLRVILAAQKTMNRQGKMVIRHVNETIREVFEVTGFIDILTIE